MLRAMPLPGYTRAVLQHQFSVPRAVPPAAYAGYPVQIRTVTARASHILTRHPANLRDSGVGTPKQL